MSVTSELNAVVDSCGLPVETGVFSDLPPDEYVVVTPLMDHFELFADNKPGMDVQETRLSLFSKGNYLERKNALIRALLAADFTLRNGGTSAGRMIPAITILRLTSQRNMRRNHNGNNRS